MGHGSNRLLFPNPPNRIASLVLDTITMGTRGGQTFPKSTEFRIPNFSVLFFPYFSVRIFPWWQNRFPTSFSNVPADWEANSG